MCIGRRACHLHPDEALPEGSTTLQATVQDFHGHASSPATLTVVIDTTAPAITFANVPADGLTTNQTPFTIAGQLSEPAGLTVDGTAITVDAARHFSYTVTLVEGSTTFSFMATDAAGHTGTAVAQLTLDTSHQRPLTRRTSRSALPKMVVSRLRDTSAVSSPSLG